MFRLRAGIKNDPERRWALPDRIFFGHGACHILAGIYLSRPPLPGFRAERIIPSNAFAGNHIYVTNGDIAFDHHGYCALERLLAHHRRCWSTRIEGWDCTVETVDFDLLSTAELNARKMRGPDQHLLDPRPRAQRFIDRVDHGHASAKAYRTV